MLQISNIRIIKEAMREASYMYAELVALGAAMGTLDVGGEQLVGSSACCLVNLPSCCGH